MANITGWAVAVTCYISHIAKHRKMADFEFRPLNRFWWNLAISEFLFFIFCFFFQHAPRSHFLTDRDGPYAKKRVSGKEYAFWGLHNIWLHLWGQTPQKFSPNGRESAFSQPNQRSSKITIYRSLMSDICVKFYRQIDTGTIIEKMQN